MVCCLCVAFVADPIDPQMWCHIKGKLSPFYLGDIDDIYVWWEGAFIFLLSNKERVITYYFGLILGGAKRERDNSFYSLGQSSFLRNSTVTSNIFYWLSTLI